MDNKRVRAFKKKAVGEVHSINVIQCEGAACVFRDNRKSMYKAQGVSGRNVDYKTYLYEEFYT